MDAATKQKTSSRWSREPSLDKLRPGEALKIVHRDAEIMKLLYRYRYLPSNDIHAFVGGGSKGLQKRLNFLSRQPHCLINRPAQQRENANANYTHLVYELDTAGATYLRELGLPKWEKVYHRNFVHELMLNRIMLSLELGMRGTGATLITWPDILAAEHTPKKLKEAEKPTQIPYEFRVKGVAHEAVIAADGLPFGVEREGRYLFFPGIEADCGTEPVSPADYDRSSIKKKFIAYLDIIETKRYAAHFGFPNMFVPFFFPTIARMESAIELLEKMTADKPALRRFFLFKTFPTLTSFGKQAPATGHVFTEPFARAAGHKPFSLLEGR